MTYTKSELDSITYNILEYAKLKTTHTFQPNPKTGEMTKYEIDMTPKLQKQLFEIAQSVKDRKSHEKYGNAIVGSAPTESTDY